MDSQPQRQSSLILGLRAFTMLAGLVAVPLAAIFGSSLPDLVKQFGSEPTEDLGEPVTWNTTIGRSRGEAPKFEPFAGPPIAGPATGIQSAPQDYQPRAMLPPHPQPLAQASQGQSRPVETPTQASYDAPAAPQMSVPPAEASSIRSSVPVPAPARPLPAGTERFTAMERRLRDLGATYYLLEAWGGEAGLFRFHSKMAIAGNAQLNRHFEATDPDPLRAMERVLLEVEAWRAGRQP